MSDVVNTELAWVALTPDEEGRSTEIFFRGQDVVDGLRAQARQYGEAAEDAIDEGAVTKAAARMAFSAWLSQEADAYDVAIMQAMLNHEAEESEGEDA